MRSASLALAMALLALTSSAAAETGDLVRFVACPIYRDTDAGRKSGCWLATDPASGIRYDVTPSPYKPDWNLAVLVEGRMTSGGEELCGGKVLDPVRTSRLDTACTRHMLPDEGFPGRRFTLPARNIQPLGVARPVPAGPFTERVFTTYFEFDNAFLVYQYDDFIIDNAVTWLRAARPKKLVITGFAATGTETVSGVTLSERPEVAKERADAMAETFRRMLPGIVIETHSQTDARQTDQADADTIPGQSKRRAEIRAIF